MGFGILPLWVCMVIHAFSSAWPNEGGASGPSLARGQREGSDWQVSLLPVKEPGLVNRKNR